MQLNDYPIQSIFGTTDCQFIADPSHPGLAFDESVFTAFWNRVERQCATLRIDTTTGAETSTRKPTSLGVITINRRSPANAHVRKFGIIDGYQRLMTLQLLLTATRDEARTHGDTSSTYRLFHKYLVNQFAFNETEQPRLVPPTSDQKDWAALLAARSVSAQPTGDNYEGIFPSYRFLRDKVSGWLANQLESSPDTMKSVPDCATSPVTAKPPQTPKKIAAPRPREIPLTTAPTLAISTAIRLLERTITGWFSVSELLTELNFTAHDFVEANLEALLSVTDGEL